METMERDAEYIASQCKYIRKMLSLMASPHERIRFEC